ncbi:MAG: 4Fe-4S dicluster domain-containing protein [Terriglobales bacterium]
MRYGFVIDQTRCIGCHACTVACKEEHGVPVGVFRTWVKYVEKGAFPDTERHFGVMRCNHCDDAPCTQICPTRALFRRDNGIVDFDPARCIGCKGCMQACPYDALYIDPATQTAAKCNFCAHRVEEGREPSCVIVCPTQAILAGDLDDPASRVSQVAASGQAAVRKPEKGTKPKLYYLGIDQALLHPELLEQPAQHLWAERAAPAPAAKPLRPPPLAAPREVYNVAHPAPWGRAIVLYLWAKSVAAGMLLLGALALAAGAQGAMARIVAPAIALGALAVTMAALVLDLKRPERFFYLLTKPHLRSWLVLGAYVLMVYGALGTAWLLCGIFGTGIPPALAWASFVFALAAAGYSAFLFAQAKGRDLWQSKLFFWHLLAQAFLAGASVWLLVEPNGQAPARITLGIALATSLIIIALEIIRPQGSEEFRLAAATLTKGQYRGQFWGLAVGAGLVAPLVIVILAGGEAAGIVAALLALAGLWCFEDLWVRAGQAVPLS